jgi:hypothetical protein
MAKRSACSPSKRWRRAARCALDRRISNARTAGIEGMSTKRVDRRTADPRMPAPPSP